MRSGPDGASGSRPSHAEAWAVGSLRSAVYSRPMTTRFRPSPTRRAAAPRHSEPRPGATSGGGRRPSPRRRPAPAAPAAGAAGGQIEVEAARFDTLEPPRVTWREEPGPPLAAEGTDHVAVLVRDPETLFVFWEVAAPSLGRLRRTLGSRVVAVSPLALRVTEATARGSWLELPPAGACSAYLRVQPGRTYRVDLGLMAPSGVFHPLASAEAVTTPWAGPAAETARQTVDFHEVAGRPLTLDAAPTSVTGADAPAEDTSEAETVRIQRGGASDLLGPAGGQPRKRRGGASDAFRR